MIAFGALKYKFGVNFTADHVWRMEIVHMNQLPIRIITSGAITPGITGGEGAQRVSPSEFMPLLDVAMVRMQPHFIYLIKRLNA